MTIIQIDASYGQGSTGRIALDLRHSIEKDGEKCYIASSLIRDDLQNDSRVYRIGHWLDHKLHGLLCRFFGKQAYFSTIPTLRLMHFISKVKPDIIHFHDLHANYIHLNLLLHFIAKKDIRLVITLHDCWFFTGGCFHFTSVGCDKWKSDCGNCPKRFMDTPAFLGDRSSFILSDRVKYLSAVNNLTVVGVSKWITNEFKQSRVNCSNVLTIHNGVDLDVFKPVESDIKKRLGVEDRFIILGPASKWLQKVNQAALDYFLENMPSDTIILLFGCTEKRKNLPTSIIQLEFSSNTAELVALYSSADVFVNCSQEDSLPMINLEAQSCGTPVITYDCTGLGETVDGVHSFCVPTGDYKSLFERAMMLKDVKREDLSTKTGLREFIQENFRKDTCYSKYLNVYRGLIS